MIDRATDILGLVDVQPTFMPGGELRWRTAMPSCR